MAQTGDDFEEKQKLIEKSLLSRNIQLEPEISRDEYEKRAFARRDTVHWFWSKIDPTSNKSHYPKKTV